MKVRLAAPSDEEVLVEMAKINIETTRPGMTFSERRCRETIHDYLEHASPTIFVAEHEGEVYGGLVCDFYEYRAADGLYTVQEVLFVRPEKRGGRAAALLMRELIAWSEMLGAREIIGGNDNEFNSDRTAKFLEHFGFKRVGHSMRRDI